MAFVDSIKSYSYDSPMDGISVGMSIGGGMNDMRGNAGVGGGGGMRRPLGARDDPYSVTNGYPQEQSIPAARNTYPYAGSALRNNNYPVATAPAAVPQGYARGGYNPTLAHSSSGGGYGYGSAVATAGPSGSPTGGYYGAVGVGYGSGYG